jgi:hypothetical protein
MGTGLNRDKGQAFPADFFPNLRKNISFSSPAYRPLSTAYCFSLPEPNLSLNRAILSLNQANLSQNRANLSLNQAILSLRKPNQSHPNAICSILEANCSTLVKRLQASDFGLQASGIKNPELEPETRNR